MLRRRTVSLQLFVTLLVAVGALLPPGGAPAQAQTPQPVSEEAGTAAVVALSWTLNALERGDVSGVQALIADDVQVSGIGFCRESPCSGRLAVRREAERQAADTVRYRARVIDIVLPVAGTVVGLRGRAEVSGVSLATASLPRVVLTFEAEVRGGLLAQLRWTPDTGDATTAEYTRLLPRRMYVAALNLAEVRPCLPLVGAAVCDAERLALWNGDATAWAAHGVRDAGAVFEQTLLLRLDAGDPATIAAFARILRTPYLKVTRLVFAGDAGEYVEITNLGGGPQAMTGWTVRSPGGGAYSLPASVVLQPGQTCVLHTYVGPSEAEPGGPPCRATTRWSWTGVPGSVGPESADVWPDTGGSVALTFDLLGLAGDFTFYSALRTDQPPPPNLHLVAR